MGFPTLCLYRPRGHHGCLAAIKRRSLAYQHDAWKSSRLRHVLAQSPSTSKRRRNSSLEERADASTIAALPNSPWIGRSRRRSNARRRTRETGWLGLRRARGGDHATRITGRPHSAGRWTSRRRAFLRASFIISSRRSSSWRQSSPTTLPSSPAPFRSRGRAAP